MPIKIKFNLNNPVQTNFLGNNAVFHGYAGLPDSDGRVYSDELCEIEADRAAELGLRVARTFYGWYAWDGEKWDWNNKVISAFYCWLERMKKRGIKVALNTGWCCPGDVNSTGFNGKSPFEVLGDWEKSVENYASWVSETLYQLIEVRGFTNVQYILLFTEPQFSTGGIIENTQTQYTVWRDCAKAVTERLISDNRRHLIKIIGPNEGGTSTSVMNRWVAENADEYVDIYSSHQYQDFYANENAIDYGHQVAYMTVPGARFQQTITLKPNTEYTFSAVVSIFLSNRLTVSGCVLIGAWKCGGKDGNAFIQAGGSPTNRLNQYSVKMFDPAFMSEEPQEILVTFQSKDETQCAVGIFSDIKDSHSYFVVHSCKLIENKQEENLLVASDFAKILPGEMYLTTDPVRMTKDGWRSMGVFVGRHFDPYYYLMDCAKTTISYIPNNKPFWFDEYNIRAEKNHYDSPIHGTHLASLMQALMNSGVQSSLMWTVFDQQWPNSHTNNDDCFVDGDHRCGTMPVLTRSSVPYPAYYAIGLVMKYMGGEEGTKVYAVSGECFVHATLSVMPDGNYSLLIVNNKSTDEKVIVDFSKSLETTMHRHIYNPKTIKPDENANMIPADWHFKVTNILEDDIPANGVAVYTTLYN